MVVALALLEVVERWLEGKGDALANLNDVELGEI